MSFKSPGMAERQAGAFLTWPLPPCPLPYLLPQSLLFPPSPPSFQSAFSFSCMETASPEGQAQGINLLSFLILLFSHFTQKETEAKSCLVSFQGLSAH